MLNWIIGSTIFVCYLSQDGSMPRSLPGGASLSFTHEVIFVMLEFFVALLKMFNYRSLTLKKGRGYSILTICIITLSQHR